MRSLALVLLAAVSLSGITTTASAQPYRTDNFADDANSVQYRERYRDTDDGNRQRYWYRGYGGAIGGGWNTWNGCPPDYTIQDGVCKPYLGGFGGGWNTWNGCPPRYTIQGGQCLPYRGP